MPNGILLSQMTPRSEDLKRFNDWYDTDHVPARMVLPHFVRASRFAPLEGSNDREYLAIYEVDDLSAFRTPGYLDLKSSPSVETDVMLDRVSGFTRYIAEEIGDSGIAEREAQFLFVVAFTVPKENDVQFNSWYAHEHVPRLLEADDWLSVRRYRVVDAIGGTWTHIALHELASLQAMDSPERARARKGPLRDGLVDLPWFGGSGRWLYRFLNIRRAAEFQHRRA